MLQGTVDSLVTDLSLAMYGETWWRYNMRMAGNGPEDGERMEGEPRDGPPPQLSTQFLFKANEYFGF